MERRKRFPDWKDVGLVILIGLQFIGLVLNFSESDLIDWVLLVFGVALVSSGLTLSWCIDYIERFLDD